MKAMLIGLLVAVMLGLPGPVRAQDASPVPYLAEEVTFDNGDITLAGTLTVPPGAGQFPAIVLVTGSGPQNRDVEVSDAMKPFAMLADSLTNAGLAVLRYDDRGVGASTGDFATATTADFATDAEAAIAFLLSRDEIDPDRIGLLGHSEGGVVAAMLGARNPDIDFLVTLAGPAVSGRDVLELQLELIMTVNGATPEEVADQRALLDELVILLDDPAADPAAIEELAYQSILGQAKVLAADQDRLSDLEDYARMTAPQVAKEYGGAWFRFFVAYDPAADWARVTVPVLALYGGKDTQVDAEQSAPELEAALADAGNDEVTIVVLPDANHLFQVAETGSPAEYVTLPPEFTPKLVPTITGWLQTQGVIGE